MMTHQDHPRDWSAQALDGVDGVSQSGAILILAQLANKLTNISGEAVLRKPTGVVVAVVIEPLLLVLMIIFVDG